MNFIETEGDNLVFNWNHLPDKLKLNIELKTKIFNELQAKFPLNKFIDSKVIFEMNKYVINRIKSENK